QGGPVQGTPATWQPTMRFGLTMIGNQAKRLTFRENGISNNTVVKLDGSDWVWGEAPPHGADGQELRMIGNASLGQWNGKWRARQEPLGRDERLGIERRGARSVWGYDTEKVTVTQIVELVPGPQSRM